MMPRRMFLVCLILALVLLAAAPALAQDDITDPDAPLAWDGQSRFTLLVMGMDRRPGARDTLRVRTDAIMLVSLNPAENSMGILHIPRDIHLTPVGTADFLRVNTLILEGEYLQEGYGPEYAKETIQYNLGMYVDRYLAIDFEAFEYLIDLIGGVEITTTYTIDDPTYPDMNYGFDPFYLPAGTHTLDGHAALQYARTRHGDNDFQRGLRQIQVLEAIHQRVVSEGMFMELVMDAPEILQELDRKYYTDLTLNDMIMLATFMLNTPRENINSGTIDERYNLVYALPDGRQVYIPNRSTIAQLLVELFGEEYYR